MHRLLLAEQLNLQNVLFDQVNGVEILKAF